ncbi:hypothetical protein ACIBSR_37065 [Streptomyces sp. NPDC049936]|uniref:hypothetical protein n=1 Tax=Streptomyces sp. NPDC049936 TaxID=3365599 RepID=UPI0037AA78E6
MTLRFIGIDPDTDKDHCPTVFLDEERGEFVIQGWKADGALEDQVRAAGVLPDHETVVRVPMRMVHIMREACDAADAHVQRADR